MEIKRIDLGFVNSYLIKTDTGFILIDTGVPASRDKLEKFVQNEGCVPGKLNVVILTHGDIDHSGNCAYLRGKYNVQIAMHRNDSAMVETGQMLGKREVKSFFMRLMHKFMAGSKMFRKMIEGFEKFKPDIYLEEGHSLKGFGIDAKVLHIPGHTPGSIGVLVSDGSFFAGDMMNNRGGKPTGAVIIENSTELAASMERLKTMDIRFVYPGHGKPFEMTESAKKSI